MNSNSFTEIIETNIQNSEDIYKVIFVLGPPGSGKNTQCAKIVSKYNLIHFGCGDLLRAAALKNDEEGKYINDLIREGKIVPVKITCGLAKREMKENGKANIFLIDGFPRNKENLDGWVKEFGETCKIIAVLFLDCPEETCCKRINIRSETSGRVDDNLDSLKKRFQVFQDETIPNLQNLSDITNVISVFSDREKSEIFVDICEKFDKLLN